MEALAHIRFRSAALAVAVVASAVYGTSIGHDFAWNDTVNIVDNESIRDLSNVPEFFGQPWGAEADDSRYQAVNANYWRPITQTSYALDYAAFGLEPAAFHAVNTLVHALVAVLVLLLGWRLFPGPGTSRAGVLLGALLFAVHPVHTETVNVVTYRADLLAGLFYLAGMVVWLGPAAGRSAGGDVRAWALWVPLLYALGVGSKEMAATLPATLVLLDWLVRSPRPSLGKLALRAAPAAAVLVGYLALRATLLEASEYTFFRGEDADTVAYSMLGVFALYGRILVAPWPLNPFYDWSVLPPEPSLWAPAPLAGLLLLVLWLGAVALTWRRRPRIALLLAVYLVALLPVSQVVPIIIAAAERFLYVAAAGPLLLAGLGAAHLASRVRPGLVLGAFAVLFTAWGGLTVARTQDWRTDRAVLEAYVRDWPESFNAWYGLARLHEEEGRTAEAARIYRKLGREEDLRRIRADDALPGGAGGETMAPPMDRRGR